MFFVFRFSIKVFFFLFIDMERLERQLKDEMFIKRRNKNEIIGFDNYKRSFRKRRFK